MALLDKLAKIEKQEIKKEKETSKIEVPKDAFDRVSMIKPFDLMQFEWRTGEYIDIRVETLSFLDHQNIRVQARANVLKLGIEEDTALYDIEYQQELSVLILWKALRHPTDKINDNIFEPAFSTPDIIKSLTPAQIEKLLTIYEVVRQKYSISKEIFLIKKNLDAWISAIATVAEEDAKKALSFLSLADLVELVLILCQVIYYMILSPSKGSVNGSELYQQKLHSEKFSSSEQLKNIIEESKSKTKITDEARLKALETIEKI